VKAKKASVWKQRDGCEQLFATIGKLKNSIGVVANAGNFLSPMFFRRVQIARKHNAVT
jgi:hypothetical protein